MGLIRPIGCKYKGLYGIGKVSGIIANRKLTLKVTFRPSDGSIDAPDGYYPSSCGK